MTALLQITDGETTANLISNSHGIHLFDWRPQITEFEPVFQESPLADGRRLVSAKRGNATETFEYKVENTDQDATILNLQNLRRLLLQALNFWIEESVNPVYIAARGTCETNTRYALIHFWKTPEDDNPYRAPFLQNDGAAVMDNLTLLIERGDWLANIPGVGTVVVANNSQDWDYTVRWQTYASLGAVPSLPAPANGYNAFAVGNSRLLALPDRAAAGTAYYSTNQGSTWVAASAPGGTVQSNDILKLSDDYILISAAGQVLRTTDGGASYTSLSLAVGGGYFAVHQSNILINTTTTIHRSTDKGQTWSLVYSFGTTVVDLAVSPTTNTIIVRRDPFSGSLANQLHYLYRSTDGGKSFFVTAVISAGNSSSRNTIADRDGKFYVLDANGDLWSSSDDGQTWAIINTATGDGGASTSFVDSQNRLWLVVRSGANAVILRSIDGGKNFITDYTAGQPTRIGLMTESDDGDYYVGISAISGSNGGLFYLINDRIAPGTSTNDMLVIANKQNVSQLSHIFVDDGGIFGSNLYPVSTAFSMLPTVPAVNDAIYFIVQSSLINSGPFCSLKFNLTAPFAASLLGGYTLVWEYWNGAAWTALTVSGPTQLNQVGYITIHWSLPTNWVTTTVNGVTGFSIRCRLSALIAAALSPATHGNVNIVTAVWPFVEISQVAGDMPALSRLNLKNISDLDGPSGSLPDLYGNRVVVGLRSNNRGVAFQAYLNISDEQNPDGVSLSSGTNTSFTDDSSTPTGRRATYNPGGVEAMATRITITIATVLVRDFYGGYHAFLRARRTGGVSTDLSVRLQISTGSGGITYTTPIQQLQTTTGFEVLDFGRLKIPVSGVFKQTDVPDNLSILIQASAASGTPDLYLYDLILIPIDTWAGDFVDYANTTVSEIGRSNGISKFLDIDSISVSRRNIRSIVRTENLFITSNYKPNTNGPAVLLQTTRQRLWFFAMRTNTTGNNPVWLAPPEICHSVKVFCNPRYFSMRGNR